MVNFQVLCGLDAQDIGVTKLVFGILLVMARQLFTTIATLKYENVFFSHIHSTVVPTFANREQCTLHYSTDQQEVQ